MIRGGILLWKIRQAIEEKIIKIQENKRALSENILGKDSGNNKDSKEIFEMDEKELMELLSFEK